MKPLPFAALAPLAVRTTRFAKSRRNPLNWRLDLWGRP
jgi:hypothetical protein